MADIREVNRKEQDKGTYILLANMAKTQKIKPGKLPEFVFRKGTYLYIGRARSGLSARIKRHLRSQKKLFWHIDYLLQKAKIEDIWIRKNYFDECNIADMIRSFHSAKGKSIKGFGSSDCRCSSHLIFFPFGKEWLQSFRNKLGFEKVEIDGNNL